MKSFYGFLNYRKDLTNTKNNLNDIDHNDEYVILVENPNTVNFNDKKLNIEKADKNVAKCFNRILKLAKESKSDYCFIIADDVIVKDKTVYQKYIDLCEEWNQEAVMFPYNRDLNMAINKFPNPISRIRIEDDQSIDLIRYPDSDFMCIKIVPDQVEFNEDLKAIYVDDWANNMVNLGKIGSFGFFIDLEKSYQYIERDKSKRIKNVTSDDITEDTKICNDLKLNDDLSTFIEYLKEIKNG